MRDRRFTFRSGDFFLVGTLTTPSHPTGVVAVLVSGSGRLDRNSDHRRAPLGVARSIATHLSRHGIASLRYDKRGVGESDGDYFAAGLRDNIADAAAAVAAVRGELGDAARHLVVVGHSEGALIATALAGGQTHIDGIILLAGMAVTGEQVLLWQGQRVAEVLTGLSGFLVRKLRINISKAQRRQIKRLRSSTGNTVGWGPTKVNARWFREFLDLDPAPLLAAIHVPVLAITGSRDVQVNPADVARMRELVPSLFDGHVIEGVNHILRAGHPSPTTYWKQAHDPIDRRVLSTVINWLSRDIPNSGAD